MWQTYILFQELKIKNTYLFFYNAVFIKRLEI